MKKIILLCAFTALCSCSDMKLTIQKIQSATDCIESYRWSWNNGVAVSDNVDYYPYGYSEIAAKFSFKTKLSGTLKLNYSLLEKSKADIEIKIDNTSAFHAAYGTNESYPANVVLTNIPKNKIIEVIGMYCTVSDVIVTSIDDGNNDSGKDFDF